MSKRDANEPDAYDRLPSASSPSAADDGGPFGGLARFSYRQIRLERWLSGWTRAGTLPSPLHWLESAIGGSLSLDRPEVLWRASGLARAGLVAQFTMPRMATRLAWGVETPLAHMVVDRLLGFDRTFAETRLQLTPVEWGVWTFLFIKMLEAFDPKTDDDQPQPASAAGPQLHARLVTLDRVGPDPFDISGLGPIVTVRWPVRIDSIGTAVRLWLPESVVSQSMAPRSAFNASHVKDRQDVFERVPGLSDRVPATARLFLSSWRAEAGHVMLSLGLKHLRAGSVLPLAQTTLSGTPVRLKGVVDLTLDLNGQNTRFRIRASTVAEASGRLLRVEEGITSEPQPDRPLSLARIESTFMDKQTLASVAGSNESKAPSLDVPVTLTVELGRLNLTLTQLADLKPGDVVELNRHSRAPVELTSNGRLVARGELILIDTDLGVRVLNVFL